ncbi:hypothetical protein L7F22_039990 [Adiantum nelumboides]|nr:hypothetical protein [Adiantum nelumboides]
MDLNEPVPEDGMDAELSMLPQKNERGSSFPRKQTDLSPPRGEKDLSPPRKGREHSPVINPPREDPSFVQKGSRRGHHDSPEFSPPSQDLSPPRRASVGGFLNSPDINARSKDLSPPRRQLKRGGQGFSDLNAVSGDLSPPRREPKRGRHDSPESDLIRVGNVMDRRSQRKDSRSSRDIRDTESNRGRDLSPPRRHLGMVRHDSPESISLASGKSPDLSPPRREQERGCRDNTDLSPTRRRNRDDFVAKGFPKPKTEEIMGDGRAAGLQSGRELAKETMTKKKSEFERVKELDITISGRNANTIYRDKHGRRLEGLEEILKLQQAEEPKKEDKPLEWGKGLVQKREAESQRVELEDEKTKPFARTRDDLDAMLREQIRWGDPMAHLVKKKAEPVLVDLGVSDQMKESGFIVPQEIPTHSWLKRGIVPPPNRYAIKPGRHWDGVDRSSGFERDMYKRQNEKKAEQVEAYLWSVADM